jgi:hypothetical protein
MFGFIQRWLDRNREWNVGQSEIWPQYLVPGPDGLSRFQAEARERLTASVGPVQLVKAGEADVYLTGKLPGTVATVYIYADGAQIHVGSKARFMAEREDFARPQELLEQFILSAKQQIAT